MGGGKLNMAKVHNVIHGLKSTILMVVVQTLYTSVNVLYKLAVNDGMDLRVLVAYRLIFATAFIVPVALIFERNKRPKLTWMVLLQAFVCGLLGGSLQQNLFAQCLALTSATFASATTNLIPAITFVLAITFRLEKLGWDKASGAKVLGTLMGIVGATVLTFYKGPGINIWTTHVDLLKNGHVGHVAGAHHNMVLGALCALGNCVCYAAWLIIQAKMIERYPCPYSSTALMVTMGSIQSIVFTLCVERDWSQWKLGWNIRLLTVAFTGVLASGVLFTLVAWCVQMRGPLFVSVFNPLSLVLVVIAGSLVLDEKLHLGSVLGAVLIVCGLYAVLWGKSRELKRILQLMPKKRVEPIEIVINSSAENNKSGRDRSTHSIKGVASNCSSMVDIEEVDKDWSFADKGVEDGDLQTQT